MKRKASFPIKITEEGVSATIRRCVKTKNGREYTAYMVDYFLLGQRKQEWRADLEEARQVASEACKKIANGEQLALQLKNGERMSYLRATEALAPIGVPLDTACREYAETIRLLNGKASMAEAARCFMKTHDVELPSVATAEAIEEMLAQAKADGKSAGRLHQLRTDLDRFKEAFAGNVGDVTSAVIQGFLAAGGTAEFERALRQHQFSAAAPPRVQEPHQRIGRPRPWLTARHRHGDVTPRPPPAPPQSPRIATARPLCSRCAMVWRRRHAIP